MTDSRIPPPSSSESASESPQAPPDQDASRPHYYDAKDLGRFGEIAEGAPDLWKAFGAWYGEVFKEGALTEREKALIALGAAHAVQCPYCIDSFTKKSLEVGSSREEMTEVVHVAAAIRGGATLVHGMQMKNKADALLF